tara:strand:+ start:531 stop:713 length:183 start_codon:yes stop_codon:yes gene_type:complete
METELATIDRKELVKLSEMVQEVQERLESLELASDPELMESLRKSKEQIKNRQFANWDEL